MKRDQILSELRRSSAAIKARGATAMFLYGSAARDEAGSESDVDLFLDYDPSGSFSALDLVDIKLLLEEELHTPVDLTTRDGPHPRLRSQIENSAVRVF